MCVVEDGYVVGVLVGHQKKCGRCQETTRCIDLISVTVPGGVSTAATIAWDRRAGKLLDNLGLGCGCYAKLHRQITHIMDSRMKSGHVV